MHQTVLVTLVYPVDQADRADLIALGLLADLVDLHCQILLCFHLCLEFLVVLALLVSHPDLDFHHFLGGHHCRLHQVLLVDQETHPVHLDQQHQTLLLHLLHLDYQVVLGFHLFHLVLELLTHP